MNRDPQISLAEANPVHLLGHPASFRQDERPRLWPVAEAASFGLQFNPAPGETGLCMSDRLSYFPTDGADEF
jgi:hypothetical protein